MELVKRFEVYNAGKYRNDLLKGEHPSAQLQWRTQSLSMGEMGHTISEGTLGDNNAFMVTNNSLYVRFYRLFGTFEPWRTQVNLSGSGAMELKFWKCCFFLFERFSKSVKRDHKYGYLGNLLTSHLTHGYNNPSINTRKATVAWERFC